MAALPAEVTSARLAPVVPSPGFHPPAPRCEDLSLTPRSDSLSTACPPAEPPESLAEEALPGPQGEIEAEVRSLEAGPQEEQKAWVDALEAGGIEQRRALDKLRGNVWSLTNQPTGCRVVQAALRVAGRADACAIVDELHGHVREALESPYGNYVVQKVVEVLPTALSSFVATELLGAGFDAARHRFGCRVLCRLLEHSATCPQSVELVAELLAEAPRLSRHSFGRHVVQSVLEHGLPEQRKGVVAALMAGGDLVRHARNRDASYVIEKALTFADSEDRQEMARELLRDPDDVAQLAMNQFGAFVVKALVALPERPQAQAALGAIHHEIRKIYNTKYGRRLLEELGIEV